MYFFFLLFAAKNGQDVLPPLTFDSGVAPTLFKDTAVPKTLEIGTYAIYSPIPRGMFVLNRVVTWHMRAKNDPVRAFHVPFPVGRMIFIIISDSIFFCCSSSFREVGRFWPRVPFLWDITRVLPPTLGRKGAAPVSIGPSSLGVASWNCQVWEPNQLEWVKNCYFFRNYFKKLS